MPFIWSVHHGGYCWAGPPDARVLTAQPGDQRCGYYAPLEVHTGLFLTFAATAPTEAGILVFANQYGLLGVVSSSLWLDTRPDERFSHWVDQIQAMRECTERWDALRKRKGKEREQSGLCDAVNKHLAASYWSATFGLRPREDGSKRSIGHLTEKALAGLPPPPLMQLIGVSQEGKVKLDTRPANLLSALWLQLAFAIVEDTHFRQCPSCRSWFAVAPERRRADAQYCKEACRVRAYKERKKAARRLHDEGKSPKQIARKLGTSVEIVEGWIVDPASGRGKSRTAKRSADF